jgi:mannose-6-phosphate isomerase-like protein (cupin superfamily)
MPAEDAVALLVAAGDDRRMTTIHSSTATDGYAMAGGEGERLWIVGDTMTFKATGESTGGRLMLLENLTAPGGGPPPHVHTREDEFFYVLDGTVDIRIGDDVHRVGPGGFAYVPRGTIHNFRNTADTPSRILIGFSPSGMEGFFREAGRPALDDGPAPPIDDDEISRTMAAAPRYGVQAVSFEDQ